jgi:hypothetical protein
MKALLSADAFFYGLQQQIVSRAPPNPNPTPKKFILVTESFFSVSQSIFWAFVCSFASLYYSGD